MITISERREHESAKSFVLRVLIDNIINTRLEPGEKLNEPELCEQLGVSRPLPGSRARAGAAAAH